VGAFPSAKEARARKAAVELELARSGGGWSPPANLGLRDYADALLETYAKTAVKPRVYLGYKKSLDEVCERFGTCKLAALTRSDVKGYVAAKLAEEAAPGTVRNRLVPLRELLAHAVEDGLITVNPAAGIRVPQKTRAHKIVPPSRSDVEKLIEHALPESRPALTVAAVCGFRRGELFALRWEDVDFDAATIHVHASNYAGSISDQRPKPPSGTFPCSSRPGRHLRRPSSVPASRGRMTSSSPQLSVHRSIRATSCGVSLGLRSPELA
jgi:integrase